LAKLSEEVGELNAAYLSATGRGRARGKSPTELKDAVEDELADVLAQVLLFADAQGIDMARAVARKWGKYMPVPEDAP
ncbi:MAG: MazG nucleotide pyrophosphohydrolase domain-containing protein, partial [Pseudomonadota bacterium]